MMECGCSGIEMPEENVNIVLLKYIYFIKHMFENLSERLEKSFKILKGQGRISEINIAETLKEVRRALLDADVNFKIANNLPIL